MFLYLTYTQSGWCTLASYLCTAGICHLTVIRGNSTFGSYIQYDSTLLFHDSCYSETKYNIITITLFSSFDCVQPQTTTCQHCVNSNVRFFYSSKQRAVFADFTIHTVGLTQRAAAGDPLSQIVFPDHSELPPHAAFQMQHSLRFNHRPHSLTSHIQLPALANLLFSQDAGRHGCKHSRQSSVKHGRKGTTADVMTPKR